MFPMWCDFLWSWIRTYTVLGAKFLWKSCNFWKYFLLKSNWGFLHVFDAFKERFDKRLPPIVSKITVLTLPNYVLASFSKILVNRRDQRALHKLLKLAELKSQNLNFSMFIQFLCIYVLEFRHWVNFNCLSRKLVVFF